ncbi:aldo/keto reductase [Streptomyces profundus]|uniref:aldo/keto reductase n=1 Tax=Streptomyces profundus TaxID=2867410 RepID=UPI001D162E3E|nr:aldo/keto reductase [Streptomyces sp. MA3_2.13]UED84955.1 aldo/keto reductase [Streptomyces sp. MA3_2.13]
MTATTHAVGSLQVSPLCLGGNVFGWTADEPTSFAVLDAYAAAGGNFVDTADVYSAWVEGNAGGESETIIGRWLARRGRRDDVVIATKAGGHPDAKGLAPDTIRRAADASLRRLGVDHIDLYYTHFDDESVPAEEIITTLDELVTAGKVREIAASNIAPERLARSLEFAERESLARYVAIQPHYNLVSRSTYEGELAELAARWGLAAMPYYALASGFLTGKYRPGTEVASRRADSAARYLDTAHGPRVLAALQGIAEERSVEPASVALAWLAARPTVAAPIASARTVDQLGPLFAGVRLRLNDAETKLLEEASTV